MKLKNMALVAALGLSMASAPVMAQTASVERSSAVMEQASAQDDEGSAFGGTTTYVIAFFVIIAIGLGIYFAFDEDESGPISA